MDVLLRDKSREVLAKKEEEQKAVEVEEKPEETKASDNVVEDAIDRGKKESEVIPTSTQASEGSTFDKYKDAFSVEQFDIKY